MVCIAAAFLSCVYVGPDKKGNEKRLKRVYIGIAILGIGAIIFAFSGTQKSETEKETAQLRAMNTDLADPASHYVLQAFKSLCTEGYDDYSQPCAVAIANNIQLSTLSADQKTRALGYVLSHTRAKVNPVL